MLVSFVCFTVFFESCCGVEGFGERMIVFMAFSKRFVRRGDVTFLVLRDCMFKRCSVGSFMGTGDDFGRVASSRFGRVAGVVGTVRSVGEISSIVLSVSDSISVASRVVTWRSERSRSERFSSSSSSGSPSSAILTLLASLAIGAVCSVAVPGSTIQTVSSTATAVVSGASQC